MGSTTAAGSVCQDAVSHCAEYGRGACTHYSNFMSDYCAKFCGFCTGGVQNQSRSHDVMSHCETKSSPKLKY